MQAIYEDDRWVWDKPGGGGSEAEKSGGGTAQQKSDVQVQEEPQFEVQEHVSCKFCKK